MVTELPHSHPAHTYTHFAVVHPDVRAQEKRYSHVFCSVHRSETVAAVLEEVLRERGNAAGVAAEALVVIIELQAEPRWEFRVNEGKETKVED